MHTLLIVEDPSWRRKPNKPRNNHAEETGCPPSPDRCVDGWMDVQYIGFVWWAALCALYGFREQPICEETIRFPQIYGQAPPSTSISGWVQFYPLPPPPHPPPRGRNNERGPSSSVSINRRPEYRRLLNVPIAFIAPHPLSALYDLLNGETTRRPSPRQVSLSAHPLPAPVIS